MEKGYGKTASGIPMTEELIEQWSAEAEAGYDVDEILARREDDAAEDSPEAEPPRQA